MLIKDLQKAINESYQGDIKRQLRDALVSLRIQGQQKLSTVAVLKDFNQRGIQISVTELIDLLQDDPMIQDVNRQEIIFAQDAGEASPEQETDEETKKTVHKMARRALNKRFKVYKR